MPNWTQLIRAQLADLRLPATREAEIAEELAQHAESRYQELLSEGMPEEQAQHSALAEISSQEMSELRSVERPEAREPVVLGSTSRTNFLNGLLYDFRYGLRTLSKTPGFTFIAVLALALGIGANTAIFSVVNGVLLQPLAYPEPDRLLKIYASTPDFSSASVSYPNYLDWRHDNHLFVDMGTFRNDDLNFTGSGQPQQLPAAYVSASLLPTLRVKPLLGRNFLPSDDRQGSACVVLLSYGFWQGQFNGDRNTLGKALTLNAMSCIVVGILPADFRLRERARVFIPIEQWNSVDLRTRHSAPGLNVIGRLKPGVTLEAAQKEIQAISSRLAQQYPETNRGHSANLVGMKADMVGSIQSTLFLLAGAVGFVLLIACANVANLLLARSAARKREFAIRAALGAERWRVVRQLLAESVLLSLGGAILGVVLARWGTALVLAAAPGSLPRSAEIGINFSVLLFALAVSIITGILFGIAPAFHSAGVNPQEALKEGARGAGGGRHRAEGIFVAVEVALAVILLSGAGLMMQSVWRLLQVNPGFTVHNVLTLQVALSPKVIASPEGIRQAYRQMLQRVSSVPGTQAAAITSLLPLGDSDSESQFWRGNEPKPPQDKIESALFYIVTPDYQNVLQMPLRQGRFLTQRDTTSSPLAVVIDDVLAQHTFHGQNPIGQYINLDMLGKLQIVGVVGHVKHWGLDSDDTSKIRQQIYFPVDQVPDRFLSEGVAGLTMAVRTSPDPMTLLPEIRSQVAGPTQDQPVFAVQTMEQVIETSLARRRFTLLVLMIFASTALLLAAVGIYGVMSFAVNRRVHEMGVRSALGASRNQIVALVLRQGMTLALAGMLAGVLAALALTRLMKNLLYGVEPGDPATLLAVTALLGVIALMACYLPARRATSVDPLTSLRCD